MKTVTRNTTARRIGAALLAKNVARHVEELEKEMKEAAKRLDFERAAELRDRIKALRKVDLGV